MPKPDLLCLVQLLDSTIETFRVSVRSKPTHAHRHTQTYTHQTWSPCDVNVLPVTKSVERMQICMLFLSD